jgi:hypothetical protein
VELRGLEPLVFWMQTTGASLLTVNWCSSSRVQMPAQDSRSAHGLLYPTAVRSLWSASKNADFGLCRTILRVDTVPTQKITKPLDLIAQGW